MRSRHGRPARRREQPSPAGTTRAGGAARTRQGVPRRGLGGAAGRGDGVAGGGEMIAPARIPLAGLGLFVAALAAQEVPPPSPVPELRRLLHSEDPAVRLAGAERLGEDGRYCDGFTGLPFGAAVPELLAAFAADPDRRVAEMAALALAAVGPSRIGALDHVSAQLDG